jgi:hypothetical protein
MTTISVTEVVEHGDEWHLTVEHEGDSGTERLLHVLPKIAFDWRAAECDIDRADTDTLLEILLCEPHLPAPSPAAMHRIWAAPSSRAAGEEHLTACREFARANGFQIVGAKVLGPIRAHRKKHVTVTGPADQDGRVAAVEATRAAHRRTQRIEGEDL